MKKIAIILAALGCLGLLTACPSEETKEEPKVDEPEDKKDEEKKDDEKGEKKDDDKKDDEKAEKDDEKKDGDEGEEGDEKAGADAKPGEIPFEYPVVKTTAAAGDFVLAPSRTWIDQAFEKGGEKQTFIYYAANMVEPGDAESKVKTLPGKEETIPNAMIVPIRKGEKAAPGDILLTWWQSGSGMKRAIVVGGSDTEPKVRYLDVKLDNPSGLGTKEDTLKPDSFHKLSKAGELGTAVAIKRGSRHDHAIIVGEAEDKYLTIGFAGKMAAVAKADCTPVPVTVDVKKGDKVFFPFIGSFREGTVDKVDAKIGRVFVKFQFGGQDKEHAAAMGDVLTSLDGAAVAAKTEEPKEEADSKPAAEAESAPAEEDKKDKPAGIAGTFKGNLTGGGANGQVRISIKGNKVSGNVQGTRNGEKFLTGFAGSFKGGKITGSGNNKNTSLRLSGKATPKNATGVFTGKVNGKPASFRFNARK